MLNHTVPNAGHSAGLNPHQARCQPALGGGYDVKEEDEEIEGSLFVTLIKPSDVTGAAEFILNSNLVHTG
jgi:hypothetical protein